MRGWYLTGKMGISSRIPKGGGIPPDSNDVEATKARQPIRISPRVVLADNAGCWAPA